MPLELSRPSHRIADAAAPINGKLLWEMVDVSLYRVADDSPFVMGGYTAYRQSLDESASHPPPRAEDARDAGLVSAPPREQGKGWSSVDESLIALVGSAAEVIPGVDAANLCARQPLLANTHLQIVATTSAAWRTLEDLQVDVGQGPSCLAAQASTKVIRSGQLQQDARWPAFAAQTSRLTMSSVLSVPLVVSSGPVGVLSVYARAADAFSPQEEERARVFATPAALVLHTAQELARTQRLAAQERALARERAVVERAVALMMNRNGGDEARAVARLHAMSRRAHEPLAKTAEAIVAEALDDALARYAKRSSDRLRAHSPEGTG